MRPRPNIPAEADPRTSRGDDLAWHAFQYVTDAMDPADVARFERRMMRDQTARAALAAAVDLLGAMRVVAGVGVDLPAGPPSWSLPRHRRPRLALASGGLAAAAAVLLAVWGAGTAPHPASITSAIDVALAWTDLRDQAARADPFGSMTTDPTTLDPAGAANCVPGDPAGAEIADMPAERPLPTWMMAAVAPEPDPDTPQAEGN